MNAANYNWTEPINRASDKPGEIQIQDVLILHPRALYASKRLGSTGYCLVDSVLEACL
jgi:hypothetical protein